SVQLPDAASLERTRAVVRQIDRIAHETDGVAHTISVSGQSFVIGAYGPNFGNLFVTLKDFNERREPHLYSDAIAGRLQRRFAAEIPDAMVNVFGPPPVTGLGTAGGFKFMIEQLGDPNPERLQGQTDNFIAKANQQPTLRGLFTVFRANSPQLFVDV